MVEIMLNNFWRRKRPNHFVKVWRSSSIRYVHNHYLDLEVKVGSGSDISLLQAPNSKFNSNLGSGAGGELDAHLHYFAFDNFCALPFLSSHTRFGFNRILSLKDVEGHC